MSRHRNVRAMNIDEEYDGYYDSAYGHSVEEEFCISPRTEAQFLYNRDAQKHSMSAFLDASSDSHMDEYGGNEDGSRVRCDSFNERPNLSGIDKAKLQSCVEAMQNVVGDTISENILVKAATENHFDVEKALDAVLSGSGAFEKPKPPRNRNIAAARKEFCIHRKCTSPNYIGWASKNNRHYKCIIKPNGCSGYPSIYDPLILDLLKMFIAFIELFSAVEKQYSCSISAGYGSLSHLKSFYSLLVPFFMKFSSSEVFTLQYRKIRKRLRRLIDFKSELRILKLLHNGYVVNEKYSGKAFYCVSKLSEFFLEMLHMHSTVTKSSLLSSVEQSHLTDILHIFHFHLPVRVLHSSAFIPSSDNVWFHCENHSITNTAVSVKYMSTVQKCEPSVDGRRPDSVIGKFVSSASHHGFVNCSQCKIFHSLHKNEHNILGSLNLSGTEYSNKGICHVVHEIENICDLRNTHLEAYVCLLLHLLKLNIFQRMTVNVNTLQTSVHGLQFNTVQCGNSSICKYDLRNFHMSKKSAECHLLLKFLNFIHHHFLKCENESKGINYVLSHDVTSFSDDTDIKWTFCWPSDIQKKQFVFKIPSILLKEVIDVLSECPLFLSQVCFETKHLCSLQPKRTINTYNSGKFATYDFHSASKKIIWKDYIEDDYSKTAKLASCKYICKMNLASTSSKVLFDCAVNLPQIVRGHLFLFSKGNQHSPFLGVHMKCMDNADVSNSSNEISVLFNKCSELPLEQSCAGYDHLRNFASCTSDAFDIFSMDIFSSGRMFSRVRDCISTWKKMVFVAAQYMKPDLISFSDCDVLNGEGSGERHKHHNSILSSSCESNMVALENEIFSNNFVGFRYPVESECDITCDVHSCLSGSCLLKCQKVLLLCPADQHDSLADHEEGDVGSTKLSMETETKETVPSVRNLCQMASELNFPDPVCFDCDPSLDGCEKFGDNITSAYADSECTVECGALLNAHLSALSVSESCSNESTESCSDLESCDDLSLDDLFFSLNSDSRENLLFDTENCTLTSPTMEHPNTGQDSSVRNKVLHIKTDSGIDVDSDIDVGNDFFSPADLHLSLESLLVDDDATSSEDELQEFPSSDIPFLKDSYLAEKTTVVTAGHRSQDILHPDTSFSPENVTLQGNCDSSENARTKNHSLVVSEPLHMRHDGESKDRNLKYELPLDNCTVPDDFNCDQNVLEKLANKEQPQQLDNLLLDHNHNVSSKVNSNQCYSAGNEQQSRQLSSLSELCFDNQDGIFNEQSIMKCTRGSDVRNKCVDGSSDEQNDVLNKSLSKIYLNYGETSENSDFPYCSSELPTLSPLESHSGTEILISAKCPPDVQTETSAILSSSESHDSEVKKFGKCDLKIHDQTPCTLSDLFNQLDCTNILGGSDITVTQSESSDMSHSNSFHRTPNCVDNASEEILSCDLSFLNSFNNSNENSQNELSEIMNSGTEQASFSGISLSDLYLDNKHVSSLLNNTSTNSFHPPSTHSSSVYSEKNEVVKNTRESETYNSSALDTNLRSITDCTAYETGEQDHPDENIALSLSHFKTHSEAVCLSKSLGADGLPGGSLLDCYSIFEAKKETKDDPNVKHAVVPNVSLSELYHSMKPIDQAEKNIDASSSLLDLYINSKSDQYPDGGNDVKSEELANAHFNSGITVIGQMLELGSDNVRTEIGALVCEHDLGSDEVDSRNGIADSDSLKGIPRFLGDDDCTYTTSVTVKDNDTPVHATLTALVQPPMHQISEPVDEVPIDIPCIDLSVAQKHPYRCLVDFYGSVMPNEKLSELYSAHTRSKLTLFTEDPEIEVTVKTKRSLFAKVLKCKSKPSRKHAIPKPPQTLPEILKSIGYNKYFQFSSPSPDEVVKTQQRGALSCPGSSSTIKPPNLETVHDEKEFVFNREISGRMVISNGEIKTPDEFESGKNKPVSESETDCDKGVEKADALPSSADEEKSKTDEQNPTSPVEQLSKLKINADDKEVLQAYKKERGGNKPLINLVVIGHVDAGKSTLMGHLLYRLGCVGKKMMHKYEQDSKKLGKSSFMYAWVLDETSEERNRGITMDVAQSRFETPHRSVTLLDAPGHKDFIPNMITGAAQADVAVLVLDSTRGEFETGFEAGGQTREHTMLIRSLGVSQLAIAVNKLDNVNWDQERYKEIVSKLSSFLKQAGFKESEVQFVPCSGLTGENLIKPPEIPELKKWYSGPCLVDVIDSFKPPERPVSKPFRFCISDVFKGMGSGFCVSGRIEAGYVQNGDKVLVMPAAEQATVKGITIDETNVQHGFAGDHVTLQLSGVDINNVTSGCVVCDIARPVKVSARFQARLVIFSITVPITKGFPVILHYQSMSEQAFVKKLISQLHRSTGQVVKKKPRCLTKNTSAVVEIEVIRPICLEVYKDFKELGRFMLRSGGSTIAAGLVTEIL